MSHPGRGHERRRCAIGVGDGDSCQPNAEALPCTVGDQAEHLLLRPPAQDGLVDRGHGRQIGQGSAQRLGLLVGPCVEPRVLDRDAGVRGEQRRSLLVLRCELALRPFRQVQVPEHGAAGGHRHPEERVHGWVVRREADGARVLAEIGESQRLRVMDQHAEDSPTPRERPISRRCPSSMPDVTN